MKKLILLSLISLMSCKKNDEKLIDRTRYPKETPNIYYNYDKDGYVTRELYKSDLNVYAGKTIKNIQTKDTDFVIYFTDGSYMYVDIYKYSPKLKFFKK